MRPRLYLTTKNSGLHWMVCGRCIPQAFKDGGRVLVECVVEDEPCVYCGRTRLDATGRQEDQQDRQEQDHNPYGAAQGELFTNHRTIV